MNSNNWLSFPLSDPSNSSLQTHMTSSADQSHHFSLGLVSENVDSPFQNQEWNLISGQGCSEVPKVADFLGVGKSENQSTDLAVYNNDFHANESDHQYMYTNHNLLQLQNPLAVVPPDHHNYITPENASNLQSLTLSMGSGKHSKCETSIAGESSDNAITPVAVDTPRRTVDTFGQRTSIYRGVTRHRWTGRYEAHLWDNSCRREGQSRKGRQVYLGGYDKEEKAARAYDMAALKYWGTSTTTNFPITNYEKEVDDMKNMTRQEFVASIRRKSSGFSRGASMYRGVTRHHQHGRWQARIGRVAGNKDLYLGTFSTEEEAAEAYDIAAIKFRGLNAVTNFDMNRYDVKSILESNTLPIGGGAAKRLKEAQAIESSRKREEMIALGSAFQYGSSSSGSVLPLAYPLMQHSYDQQPQPLLTLQNPEISHNYSQDHFHQSYIQTQLQLHQQTAVDSFNNSQQLYNSYIQNNPSFLHGFMNMGSSSSVMDNNGSSSNGSYSTGGYLGHSTTGNGGGGVAGGSSTEDLGMGMGMAMQQVKVDYDMPSVSYNTSGGWSGDSSVQGSNPAAHVFSMWND